LCSIIYDPLFSIPAPVARPMQNLKPATSSDASRQLSHPRDNFDAIRLIAALIVVYGHAFPLSGVASPNILGNEVQTLAVKVFFVISGYLVIESWRRDPSPYRYLWRRCLRIFPGLFVCVVLSAFVLGPLVTWLPLKEYLANEWTRRYLGNIVLYPSYALPGVFDKITYPNAVNGSLWTLPVEFSMYLLCPLVVLWGRGEKLRILIATVILCAAGLYLVRFARPAHQIVFYATDVVSALDAAPYFFLGASWRILAPQKAYNLQAALLAVLMLAAIPQGTITYEIGLYLVLPYAILSFSLAKPAVFGWTGRFGDFSYGVYIYGFVVQQTVSYLVNAGGRPYVNFLISVVPTLVLSVISWHLIEKKFLLLKPKKRRAAATALATP